MSSILDDAPRGATKGTVGGKEYTFRLTMEAIERWEDKHPAGIYRFLADIGEGKVTLSQSKDLLAVGLVGAGLSEKEAKAVIDGWKARDIFDLPPIASRLINEAVFPADSDEIDIEQDDSGKDQPSSE